MLVKIKEESRKVRCFACGEFIDKSEATQIEGEYYCQHCTEEDDWNEFLTTEEEWQ